MTRKLLIALLPLCTLPVAAHAASWMQCQVNVRIQSFIGKTNNITYTRLMALEILDVAWYDGHDELNTKCGLKIGSIQNAVIRAPNLESLLRLDPGMRITLDYYTFSTDKWDTGLSPTTTWTLVP